ncbi:uncharacterized protein BCR38DRAFT_412926 [Pseudomassariella vexata]|uniref:Clr5 domain-containing protein n=1 Tax=Pseudomassariella vexata TaxID=1141098 RepID=A0A1Y2DJ12_9PEZI|nr:uncharacterized protein BCR38DRAFT_412926 [Pseudomassariella vexata]ORY59221.1 hypothetical protein BCR38DRAFT_412926 [Pseudomassariella vexata]
MTRMAENFTFKITSGPQPPPPRATVICPAATNDRQMGRASFRHIDGFEMCSVSESTESDVTTDSPSNQSGVSSVDTDHQGSNNADVIQSVLPGQWVFSVSSLAPKARVPGAQTTAESWEAHREEIQRLYISENKPLKVVARIMKTKGFHATERMYKTRIAQWGTFKNKRREDISKMLQVRRQRSALGKASVFYRGGRPIDINSYLQRNGLSIYDLAEFGVVGTLPANLRCTTPPPIDQKHLGHPEVLHVKKLVIGCFQEMVKNCYGADTRPPYAILNEYESSGAVKVIVRLRAARYLFTESFHNEGGQLALDAFQGLGTLLQNWSPLAFLHLMTGSLVFPIPGITAELWKYLGAYSSVMFDKKNPLTRAFTALNNFFHEHDFAFHLDFLANCIAGMCQMLCEFDANPNISSLPYHAVFRIGVSPFERRLTSCRPPVKPLHGVPTKGVAVYKSKSIVEDQIFRMLELELCLAGGEPASSSPRHEMARYYLEKDIEVDDSTGLPSPFKLTGLLKLLEEWCREAGDMDRARTAKEQRRRLMDEWLTTMGKAKPV